MGELWYCIILRLVEGSAVHVKDGVTASEVMTKNEEG